MVPVEVRVAGREARLMALFDTSSSFTLMGYEVLRKHFGDVGVRKLVRPREAVLVNGQRILIDAFVDAQMTVKGYMIEERIYLSPDVAQEVEVAGARRRLPELIIGAPTMEMWDIELDVRKGDVIVRGVPFIV